MSISNGIQSPLSTTVPVTAALNMTQIDIDNGGLFVALRVVPGTNTNLELDQDMLPLAPLSNYIYRFPKNYFPSKEGVVAGANPYTRFYIQLSAGQKRPHLVRIYAGGVNVASCESTRGNRVSGIIGSAENSGVQDYFVVPDQQYVNGFVTNTPGQVEGFCVGYAHSNIAVQIQAKYKARHGNSLRIEVMPMDLRNKVLIDLQYEPIRGPPVTLHVPVNLDTLVYTELFDAAKLHFNLDLWDFKIRRFTSMGMTYVTEGETWSDIGAFRDRGALRFRLFLKTGLPLELQRCILEEESGFEALLHRPIFDPPRIPFQQGPVMPQEFEKDFYPNLWDERAMRVINVYFMKMNMFERRWPKSEIGTVESPLLRHWSVIKPGSAS